MAESRIQFTLAAAVLIIAFAFITFYRLGVRPLQDFDEAIYAQVAHEAMQSGNQLGFTWQGNPPMHRPEKWFEKPPLMIWLTEISEALFGVNEFAARFWTAIFAILTLPLTFLFARELSREIGAGKGDGPRAGGDVAAFVAVAAFFGAYQFMDDARILQMDIPVGFFVVLSLYAFWRARENARFYFLFWFALAFGLMIKSVIGLLPLPVIFLFSLLARDFRYLKIKNFWLGLLLFFALILPWHIIESLRYGGEFWHQYLFYHLLERYSSALEGNSGPLTFYLAIAFQEQFFFWALAVALVYFIARSFRSKAHLFVTVAIVFVFLFFSTAGTKLPPYILVIYPYAAMAIGIAFVDFSGWLEKFQKNAALPVVTIVMVIFVVAGFQNARANLAGENNSQLVSDKAVGEYLKDHCLDEPVYYYSVIRIKPSIIFYSDRRVGYYADFQKSPPPGRFSLIAQGPPHDFPNATVLFSAESEKVYQVGP
ncbi:MAG TPA: glycosyltransferase family 39 protein [Verrucomicrobiae bacterium]